LETLKLSIPARQKAPGTGISRWLREVSHYVLQQGNLSKSQPAHQPLFAS
jgi:hypothetical protein